ncbi:hypothetical protein NIES3804_18690 [Microcystis aeruginosa NIES-3804]|uniref:Uncharacterized protein n=1 Tax=Microcystis aeruginosa NIES-3804 TaxID=2517783 RepID=A0A6H9GWB6_MICAE|nr:hypothetical protein NIES3804_18690 [Microcystis aeruginosa NIES-3804]
MVLFFYDQFLYNRMLAFILKRKYSHYIKKYLKKMLPCQASSKKKFFFEIIIKKKLDFCFY